MNEQQLHGELADVSACCTDRDRASSRPGAAQGEEGRRASGHSVGSQRVDAQETLPGTTERGQRAAGTR